MKNKIEPIADLKSHNLKRENEIRANTKFLSSIVGTVFSNKNSKKVHNIKSTNDSETNRKKEDKTNKKEVSEEKKVEKGNKNK